MEKTVPDGDPIYCHDAEGPDDMPAHIRTILSEVSLIIPVRDSRCQLGTCQGIYLWEHRTAPHTKHCTDSYRRLNMLIAVWNDAVLAESHETRVVEDNHYFPTDSINSIYFQASNTYSTCFWKGQASYYDINVNGEINKDASWYYPEPKEKVVETRNYIAFWKGVDVLSIFFLS